jgi:hypothetical protein
MKLSPKTIQVLRNFASINPSILVRPGRVLSTIAVSKAVFARAEVDVEFPTMFAIYDVRRFLDAVALFSDPELEIEGNKITITGSGREMQYTCADPGMIVSAPEKGFTMPEAFVSVAIPEAIFKDAETARKILSQPELAIVGDGSVVSLQTSSVKNPSTDTWSAYLDDTDKKFKAVFEASNLRLLPGDYTVTVTAKGVTMFQGPAATYYVTYTKDSSFD